MSKTILPPPPPPEDSHDDDDQRDVKCGLDGVIDLIDASAHDGRDDSLCDALKRLASHCKAHMEQMANVPSSLATMRQQVSELIERERVVIDLTQRNRELVDGVIERELIDPIIAGLIGIADRCRNEVGRYRERRNQTPDDTTLAKALDQIIEARDADRLEIESLLDHLHVKPFVRKHDLFSSHEQKCLARVTTDDAGRHGRVAQRLQPGYRRHGKVIRPEYVSVYTTE